GDELLTAITPDHVDLTRILAQNPGCFGEHEVPGRVPVGVIEKLEAIEVEHHDGKVLSAALDSLMLLVQELVDVPVVEQTRQPIGDREAAETLVDLFELLVLPVELVLELLDAQHRADARLQLGEVDRLREVVVRTGIET